MKFLKSEYLQAAFLILVFLSLFFWENIFLGQSIVDSRIHYTDPVYRELGIETDYYPFFRPDPFYALFDHPALLYSYQAIKSGWVPLWNPYNAGGMPFFANFMFSPIFPLRVPFYSFSLPMKAYSYYLISRLFFAGFFTYLFGRRILLSRYGAALAAVSYMGCGFMVAYFQYNVTQPALMPLLFVALQKLLTTGTSRSVLFLSAAMGLVVFADHPSTSLVIFTGLSLYFLTWNVHQFVIRYGERRRGKVSSTRPDPPAPSLPLFHLRRFILAGILGISLSLVATLPFIEFLKNGHTYKEEAGHIYLTYKRLAGDGLKNLAGLFIPHYKVPWFASSPYPSNTYAYQSYAGLVTLVLALYALMHRVINWGLLAVLAFGSGLAFGIAPLSALNYVFPFIYIPAEYGLILVSFSLALFGGIGLDILLRQPKDQVELGKLLWFVGFLAINFFVGFARQIDWVDSPWSEWKRLLYTGAMLAVINLIYLLYRRSDSLKPAHLARGLILLGIFDLFYNGHWVNFPQPEFHFPETKPIQALKKDRGVYRILSMNGVNRLNSGLIHQLSDIQVIDTIQVRRYHEFLTMAAESAGRSFRMDPDFYDSRFWDIMNVKYILREAGKPLPLSEKFRLIYQDPYVLIYENLKAFPRAFPVHQAIITENQDRSLQQLKDPTLDLRRIVLLELPPGNHLEEQIGSLHPSLPPDRRFSEGNSSTAQIVSYSPHEVLIDAQMERPGILVLGDTYYPGWRVWVDGQPEVIFPANHLFRGVYLREGDHSVKFAYRPISYRLGLYVSLFSLGVGSGVLIARS